MAQSSLRRPAVIWLGLLMAASGCQNGMLRPASPMMAAVPRQWRSHHPWGPEANELRARGELPPRFYTQQMADWAEFGRQTVQEGDILFRKGRSNTVTGWLQSHVVASISDSRFSHNAIAHFEDGKLYLYDAEQEGIRKIPFEFWMLDVADHSLVIKRPRPEFRSAIPAAIAYCDSAYRREVPFDSALRLDDDRLYCSEMIEKAYRSGGVCLSDPVPIRCLPHYPRYSELRPIAETFTEYRVDEPVFAVGNDVFGTFGSPCLETVYDDARGHRRPHHKPPLCAPVPYPLPVVSVGN